jgi:hypothetical protein
MRALRFLGYVWSAPYALLGVLALGLFKALGWVKEWAWRDGAFEVVCQGPFAAWMSRPRVIPTPAGHRVERWAAFTLGWTILLWYSPDDVEILPHEHRHVDQALVLGVFFPLVWGVAVAIQGYRNSVLEVDARQAASARLEGGRAEKRKA